MILKMFLYIAMAYIWWENWRLECKLCSASAKIDKLLEKLDYFCIYLPDTADRLQKKIDDAN